MLLSKPFAAKQIVFFIFAQLLGILFKWHMEIWLATLYRWIY